MILTSENYFSIEADREYMSVSQYKNFKTCEAKALHDLEIPDETYKESFLQGSLFEALVAGDPKLFMAQHPEMISTRGSTAGKLKSEFQRVVNAAEKFNSQEFFKNIINKCEKQVILTGIVNDVPVKCCLDLFDRETFSIYDIKCMKDFNEQWSKEEKKYIPWYYSWGYVLQLAVYRLIVKQNFNCEPKEIGLLAASKEEIPDIQALKFDDSLLGLELIEFKNNIKHYDNIKKGLEKPIACGVCQFCKQNKTIKDFEVIR